MAVDQSVQQSTTLCRETPDPKEAAVSIQDVFQKRVLEQPDAPAVCSWDGSLTYQELDIKSSALARILAQNEVKAGVFVSLCFERSLWTAVSLFAVLKAGGVFCFLEPEFPLARLQDMCRRVNAKVVLCGDSQHGLAKSLGKDLLVLPINDELLETSSPSQELGYVAPDQPAYVAFTSGSTGRPKGILVSHQALLAGIILNYKPLHQGPSSRILHFASFAFDVAFLEHFWALLMGGCLCVPSEFERKNNIMEAMEKLQVNWAFFTPSVARVLQPTKLPTLRYLHLGGEPITQYDIELWSPHVQVIGIYGPAECAGCVTIQSEYKKGLSSTNIGFPHAVTCWVVDENDHNTLVPEGSVGELVISGPSLSEGYINDPELTGKFYISNTPWFPASKNAEERLYKTGDLVRSLPDGSFIFLGRKDTQVKINGQRIELEEVEHHTREVLGGNPGVIVEAVTASRSSKSLVAFIHVQNTPPTSELFLAPGPDINHQINTTKTLLQERLPTYMIPEGYVFISRIPSTMTGKSDRKALRERFSLLPRAHARAYFGLQCKEKSAPVTAAEKQMQKLWANVLNLDLQEVGRDDNWISLGGDSLAAMKLVSMSRQEQIFITVPEVFRHRTISTLCKNIQTDISEMVEKTKPFELLASHELQIDKILDVIADQCQVSRDCIEDSYPITSLQLDAALVPIKQGYNYTLHLDFKLPPDVDIEKLAIAWERTVASNPILRTRIIELTKGTYIQAVIKYSIPLDDINGPNRTRYEPASDIWGLGKRLVGVAVQKNRFIMLIHHTIYDGQSLPLLFQDISNAYKDQQLTLRQFAPFIRWSTDLSAAKRQFWTEKFAGFNGRVFPPVLDPSLEPLESRELTGNLNVVNDDFTTTNKIRVSFAIVVSWHYNTNDVVFGAVLARRSAPIPDIIESAVPTTAMLPDRIKLDPNETLRHNLEVDQENILSLISHEGIDDRVIEELSPESAAACMYGTLLAVQPDLDDAYPEIFRKKDMRYYGPICALNALMQCSLSAGSASISLRLSERTMKGVYCWELFMEEFQAVFHFIQKNPEIKLCDLRANLDTLASLS